MPEEKSLPLPEKELPPPHDMLLESSSGNATKPPVPPKPTSGASMPGFWDKYGSKKWLLPLLVAMGVLIFLVGIVAFMGSTDNTNSRKQDRQERKEQRQDRKNNKKKQNNKNKRQRGNKNTKKNANAGMVTFTYGTGANKISMRYPGDMKTNITNSVSALNSTTPITLITFSDKKNIIKMMLEPNATNLSAASWQSQLAGKNDLYNTPTEAITIAGKPALMQHTLSSTADWNAYVPMSGTMLWIDMNYGGGKNKAKTDFTEMLNTIQIGAQSSSTSPSVSVMPTM